ncbi:hypothetical protein MMC11_001110 [Xylographa trunciseda]|nr:hypothetical protein [Xylographa trunciseda]
MIQISIHDNIGQRYKTLPKPLQRPLRKLLRSVENFSCVTNIFAHLEENTNGQITIDTTNIDIADDMFEKDMSDENQILEDIKDFGCRRFRESDVIQKAQISCFRYQVWVQGRYYVERKVPFASAGLQGDNAFHDFVAEVKRLNSLRGCAGIIQFAGVVLDDTERHLKGYLCEPSSVRNLRMLFGLANHQSMRIPWAVRKIWIRQIIAAISNVHARGLVIGALNINRIDFREDGTLTLDLSDSAHRHLSMRPEFAARNSQDYDLQCKQNTQQ